MKAEFSAGLPVSSTEQGRRGTRWQAPLCGLALAFAVSQAQAQEILDDATPVRPDLSFPMNFTAADERSDTTTPDMRAKIEELSHIKGWHIPTGSAFMTLMQDNDGFRSRLASHGIGLVASSSLQYTRNALGSNIPDNDQQYWGQIDSFSSSTQVFLTYDLDQHGIDGAQLVVGGTLSLASWDNFNPGQLSISTISLYKPFFDGRVELKAGLMGNTFEWIGTAIGGNSANPLGQNASIPAVMGLAPLPSGQPSVKLKWNVTEKLYAQAGVMRSLPIGGPTGNIILDEINYNPTGLRLTVPNGKALTMGEIGYKQDSGVDTPALWIRAGMMHNTSEFARFDGGPASGSAKAGYFLIDKQIIQPHADDLYGAYKGLYVNASYMKAPEENIALYEQLELKAYYQAPFENRPFDQLAFVYSDSKVSSGLQDLVNGSSSITGVHAVDRQRTYNLIYTAYLADGIWGTIGATYVDNPTITYAGKKDEALNLSGSIYLRF